jgi:hypothetical protein
MLQPSQSMSLLRKATLPLSLLLVVWTACVDPQLETAYGFGPNGLGCENEDCTWSATYFRFEDPSGGSSNRSLRFAEIDDAFTESTLSISYSYAADDSWPHDWHGKRFSARWSRLVPLTPGYLHFEASSSAGYRVIVRRHPPQELVDELFATPVDYALAPRPTTSPLIEEPADGARSLDTGVQKMAAMWTGGMGEIFSSKIFIDEVGMYLVAVEFIDEEAQPSDSWFDFDAWWTPVNDSPVTCAAGEWNLRYGSPQGVRTFAEDACVPPLDESSLHVQRSWAGQPASQAPPKEFPPNDFGAELVRTFSVEESGIYDIRVDFGDDHLMIHHRGGATGRADMLYPLHDSLLEPGVAASCVRIDAGDSLEFHFTQLPESSPNAALEVELVPVSPATDCSLP